MSSSLTFDTAFASYSMKSVLGEGGSGIVYRVEDDNAVEYALKRLKPDQTTTQRAKRFQNELTFCYQNEHPNIVRVKDFGFSWVGDVRCPFYVMRCFPSTLRKGMKEGIQPDDVLRFFSMILDGVEAAHLQRIWHRDLKPENILMDPSTDDTVVADFGIAHFSEEELYTAVETRASDRLANFPYSAPEQRVRGEAVDHRADLYALGLILNEMFTGKLLQGSGFVRIGDVAPQYGYLDDLVDLMTRQSSEGRPESIDFVKQQLIARENEFVSRQRLDALNRKVVPTSEVDDPLVNDPISLIGVDYSGGELILKLSRAVSGLWVDTFHSIGNYSGIMGKGPRYFRFSGESASIEAGENDAKQLRKHFEDYVSKANDDYRALMLRHHREQEAILKHELQRKTEEEERRQRILMDLRAEEPEG